VQIYCGSVTITAMTPLDVSPAGARQPLD